MKKAAIIILVLLSGMAQAQILKPAHWTHSLSQKEVVAGAELELIFSAVIDKDWYLYSSDFDPDLGPIVTTFNFEPHPSYETLGEIVPVNPSKKYDEIWEGAYTYFKGTAEFRQKVRILKANPEINGSYSYQVCSDIDGKCIPFEEDFSFDNIMVLTDGTVPVDAEGSVDNVFVPAQLDVDMGSEEGSGIILPATWSFSQNPEDAKKGDEAVLIFKADIDPDWFLYSSDFTLDPGPIPAAFNFEPNETYQLIEETKPIGAQKKYDKIFEGEVSYFKGEAEFRQRIKVLDEAFYVKGSIEYQVCSDVDGKCIPFEEDFSFGISGKSETGSSNTVDAKKGSLLKSRDSYSAYSLLAFMVIAFLGGLAALFTPCVFPMIPMTVSFFTGKAKNRKKGIQNALLYGFFIVLIYTLIGSLLAPFMGPEMANELATNWIPNIIFFLVFLVFALSFFGLFEITLPSKWVNNADKQADKGGIAGIFFMAFTLVMVSFSCTGPIVGSILVESAGGQALKPVMGMLAFSLAFAVPFTLFAVFPEWLNSLPKSGGWLNSVKVVLGFLELAFSLKFLSIADQAYHWGILDREVYLAFWIVIFAFLGFYFLGKIRLPNDSKMEFVPVSRLILGIITFTFVVYLIPGMFGAPLKGLAGYLPPMSTHDFDLSMVINRSQGAYVSEQEQLCEAPMHADFLHLPHGMQGYFDYDQALACAREKDKPVFIDFTGHGCVNCREMEARVWSDPEVLKRLKNNYIVLALYVDDKTELQKSEWYTSPYDGKVKKSIGKQNADLQIRKFKNNAQPFYVLLDPTSEKSLLEPRAYDLDVQEFIKYLDAGISEYLKKP